MEVAMREQHATGLSHCGLAADVRNAQRWAIVVPQDWPLQAAQVKPGGAIYLNCVGTYGIACASYWWGRLAAAAQR
eukprot:7670613-Alexandrium_andersonii.AAC.1